MLDERKMRILQAVTDDYIVTAEPIGSRTVARRHDLGISPATIRNEMADLEELGYLQQPHTSAGRIPSDKGYRYYVDELMEPYPKTEAERELVRREVRARGHAQAMEELIFRAARLLSALSRYTALVAAPRLGAAEVHHLQLLPLDPRRILLVLVLRPGFVVNRMVSVGRLVAPGELQNLSEYLSRRLRGMTVSGLGATLFSELREDIADPVLAEAAIELLEQALNGEHSESAYLDGITNILHQPEFRDVEKARELLGFLDDREQVAEMLAEYGKTSGIRVTIGSEHPRAEMRACSVVTATYSIGSTVVGTLGVLGPTRMEYARAVALVEMVAESLSDTLTEAMKG